MTDNNVILDQRPTTNDQRPTTNDQRPDSCPLISIVILAYNCEKFITKTLFTLINQEDTERNYEIIITDDGSTDSTGAICDEYASKYTFIHVTHTKNQGTAAARNVAVPQCKGKYITFCDADDFVSPQMIAILTRLTELHSDADIIAFKYANSFQNNDFPVYDINGIKKSDAAFMNSEDFCVKIITDTKNFGSFTWNKLIRSEITKSIPFDENTSVMDDQTWVVKVLCTYKDIRICCTDYILYCYVLHENYGQTRNISRVYKSDGLSWFVVCVEKELAIKDIPGKVKTQLEGNMYFWVIRNLYEMGRLMTDETRKKLKGYGRKYAYTYYFRSRKPLSQKIKFFIKHILVTLHIYK